MLKYLIDALQEAQNKGGYNEPLSVGLMNKIVQKAYDNIKESFTKGTEDFEKFVKTAKRVENGETLNELEYLKEIECDSVDLKEPLNECEVGKFDVFCDEKYKKYLTRYYIEFLQPLNISISLEDFISMPKSDKNLLIESIIENTEKPKLDEYIEKLSGYTDYLVNYYEKFLLKFNSPVTVQDFLKISPEERNILMENFLQSEKDKSTNQQDSKTNLYLYLKSLKNENDELLYSDEYLKKAYNIIDEDDSEDPLKKYEETSRNLNFPIVENIDETDFVGQITPYIPEDSVEDYWKEFPIKQTEDKVDAVELLEDILQEELSKVGVETINIDKQVSESLSESALELGEIAADLGIVVEPLSDILEPVIPLTEPSENVVLEIVEKEINEIETIGEQLTEKLVKSKKTKKKDE